MSNYRSTSSHSKGHASSVEAKEKEDKWTILVRQGDFELMVQGTGKEETVDLFERMIDQYGRANDREKESPQSPVPVA